MAACCSFCERDTDGCAGCLIIGWFWFAHRELLAKVRLEGAVHRCWRVGVLVRGV